MTFDEERYHAIVGLPVPLLNAETCIVRPSFCYAVEGGGYGLKMVFCHRFIDLLYLEQLVQLFSHGLGDVQQVEGVNNRTDVIEKFQQLHDDVEGEGRKFTLEVVLHELGAYYFS